jgi:long-subunit fatty acid transport protein
MKTFTLCSAVLLGTLISNTAAAQKVQVQKGSFIAGLNFSVSGANNLDSNGSFTRRRTKINYSPFVSYAVAKNFTVGAYLGFNRIDNNPISFSKYNHNFSAAIFTRKYIPFSNKFYAFVQGDIRYTTMGLTSMGTDFSHKSLELNLSGGFGYNISKKFSVELGINNIAGIELRKTNEVKNGVTNKYNNTYFNGGRFLRENGLSIGIVFRF